MIQIHPTQSPLLDTENNLPELLAIATTFWGIVMSLAPLLQIRVIQKNRDASGISVSWLAIMLIGFVLWTSYGLVNAQLPLVIANVVAIIVSTALLIVIAYYRHKYRVVPEVPSP
jgi:MtN3 and saliva related transmembrane protein